MISNINYLRATPPLDRVARRPEFVTGTIPIFNLEFRCSEKVFRDGEMYRIPNLSG